MVQGSSDKDGKGYRARRTVEDLQRFYNGLSDAAKNGAELIGFSSEKLPQQQVDILGYLDDVAHVLNSHQSVGRAQDVRARQSPMRAEEQVRRAAIAAFTREFEQFSGCSVNSTLQWSK